MTQRSKHVDRAGATTPERDIQTAIRLELGQQPDVVLWRNNVGRAGPVVFGLEPGAADLIGIGPGGVFLALEVKSATGRVRPDQVRWGALVAKYGGVYAVVRSAADAMRVIQELRARLSSGGDQ